jgi:hypothetical protein
MVEKGACSCWAKPWVDETVSVYKLGLCQWDPVAQHLWKSYEDLDNIWKGHAMMMPGI